MSSGNSNDRSGPQKGPSKAKGPPPALNPETPALTQPWKDFISKGWLTALTVEFTPLGLQTGCIVQPSLRKAVDPESNVIALGEAKNRIVQAGLWTPRGANTRSGTTNDNVMLPKKSLTKKDLEGDDNSLRSRAIEIGKALGDTTARGRIGSLKMFIEGEDTFAGWWSRASAAEKSRLFSDKKHHDEFTEPDHLRIAKVVGQCPFRGSVPSQTEEKETEETNSPPSKDERAVVLKKKSKA
jgi:hypothetical protein